MASFRQRYCAFLPTLPQILQSRALFRKSSQLPLPRYRSPVALKRPPDSSPNTKSASSKATSSSPSNSTSKSDPSSTLSPLAAILVLNSVPFLWATYPILSSYLTHLPQPPPRNLLNFFIYVAALLPIPLFRPSDVKLPLLEGAELGTYLFGGTILLLASLEYTTASRAALLVQSTTVFVPAISFLLGRPVGPKVGISAVIAMLGIYVLEQATGGISFGDALALLSALCYSVHMLRLERIDQPSVPLLEAKTRFQTVLAVGLLAVQPDGVLQYLQTLPLHPTTEKVALFAGVLWLGVCSSAFATWLQIIGQSVVGGSKAAVFYSSQPAWAVGLAYVTGLCSVHTNEIVGAILIFIAALLTSLD